MPTGRPMLTDPADEAVRLEQLAIWNNTQAPIETRSVIEFFTDHVTLRPDAVAVVDGARRITYGELGRLVAELASHLTENAVVDEAVVAVGMPRSAEMVVSILAILTAGGAFVPVDPLWPAQRRAGVLADAGAVRVLTAPGGEHVDDVPGSIVDLDEWAYDGSKPIEVPCATGARLAYVIFTSGSTGRPKGAMIRHEAIVARLRWQVEEILHFGPEDASMFKAPLSFDISVNEILLPLVSGGRVVVAKPGGERDPQYLLDLIASEEVTFVYLVSSMLDVLLELSTGTDLLDGLKHVWCGGEVLTPELFDRFRSALGTTLYHGYGPAETTIGLSHVVYRDGADRIATSIGTPNPNTQLYVLDDELRPVGIGEGGELYAGGFLLGRGYVGAPPLTAGRFVANPFDDSGARLYRTGDLARWAPDGSLDFLGRADNQVKIRGMRLELEDVENALASHPSVRRTCVRVGEHANGTKYLVGYVVPHTTAVDVTPESLRQWATEVLPEYMVPAIVVVLDEFPLTPNGKLDRRALPDPVFGSSQTSRLPQSDTERALCSIFSDVLGGNEIGVDDDFFSMGGDSIVAISLVSAARRAGLGLRPGDVFRLRTPAALAAVAGDTETARDPEDIGVGVVLGTPIVRWIGDVGGAVGGFFQSTVLTTPAGLTSGQLRDILSAVLTRHDMLRSRLDRQAPWSLYVPEDAPEIDGLLIVVETEAELERENARAAARLDPDAGLMQAALHLDAGPEATGLLVLSIHHVVIDGVSWRIIFDDLADAWASIVRGEPISLPETGTSFRRWSARLHRATARGMFDTEIGRWIEPLRRPDSLLGSRALDPKTDIVAHERRRTVVATPSVTAPLLTAVPAAFGAGVNDVLLTALSVALLRLRHDRGEAQSYSVIELEGHGREGEAISVPGLPDVDLTRTVGWFTTLFPVVLDPGTPKSPEAFRDPEYLASALKAVKETLRSVPQKGLSWGALCYLADAEVSAQLAGTAAPQVLFNYLGRFNAPTGDIWTPAVDVGTLGEERDPGMRLLRALEVNAVTSDSAAGPQLSATFSWPDGILDDTVVDTLTGYWSAALGAMARIADLGGRTPSDFPAVSLTQDQVDGLAGSGVVDILPLTPLQEGLYFHSTFDENSRSSYVEQQIFEIDGTIDSAVLRRAADGLMRRHPNLGAGFFGLDDGRVVSVLTADAPVEWVETQALSQDEVTSLAARERARGFDLDAPPLMRYSILRLEGRTVIVQTVHHIVADGWSIPLMLSELAALYADENAALHTPRPFRAYVNWLAGRDDLAAERAWTDSIGDVREGTVLVGAALGTEMAGDAVVRHGEVGASLTAVDADCLLGLARETGSTLGTVVHVAWAMLLGRLLGRTDVVFGSTVSGRAGDLDGIETMIGLFVDTAPVRVRWTVDVTVREALVQHQREHAEILEHQHLGLGRIQKIAGVEQLFDTLVVFETEIDLDGYVGTSFPAMSVATVEAPHYPLTLLVDPSAGLTLRLLFDADHVDDAEAQALLDRMAFLLSNLERSLDIPVERIDLLRPAERDTLLYCVPSALKKPSTIVNIFARNVSRYPNAAAVRFTPFGADRAEQLTYSELDRDSSRLARVLVEEGVGAESLVGLALERSTLLVTAILAVLKAGGAYVPLDTHHPADRLAYIVRDCAPVCVLTTSVLERSMRAISSRPVLVLDADDTVARAAEQSIEPLETGAPVSATWDHAAYVIYTSGSTGKPKGVLVPHRSVIELMANTATIFDFGPSDVWTMFHSFAFDFSVWELWGALLHGGTLVVVDQDVAKSPEHFLELLRSERVTVLDQTPSAFYQLIEADRHNRGDNSLRYIVFGGEALDLRRLSRWYESHPVAPTLVNMYGITETTVHVSHLTLSQDRVGSASIVGASIIGAPIDGLHLYILDSALRLKPPGFTGEIYVSGAQLARGYLGRVDLTATRFVADPFGDAGDRLYRTGDVGRWNCAGELEFIGRADDQVKIRGYRIELGEVEAAILAVPGIRNVAVLVREDVTGIRRVVAYVVSTGVDDTELAATLAQTLPEYMIPSAFVTLDAMPLTVNGKLDRTALPAPELALATVGDPAVGPHEKVLARLFSEILGAPNVGADSDFFALGGDSIVAITLVNRARKADIRFTPRDVFSDRTPRLLARRSPQEPAGSPVESGVVSGVVSGAVSGVGHLPALPIVHRLRELGGPIDRFNQSMLVQVPQTRAEHVHTAVAAVLDRHDALRAALTRVEPGSVWSLNIPATGSVSTAEVVRCVPAADVRSVVAEESNAAAERLDPARGVMLQIVWFDAGQRPGRLLVMAHHLVVDGISWQILLGDLAQAFEQATSGLPIVLDPVATPVREFALDAVLRAHESTHELELWSGILSGGGPLVDGDVTPIRPLAETQDCVIALSQDVTAAVLTRTPAALRADITEVLLAALQTALSRWHVQRGISPREVLIDLERHGRESVNSSIDLSRTIGWFSALAPTRSEPHSDPLAALRSVKNALRAVPNGGIGFGLLRYLDPQTSPVLAAMAHPQVLFNYMGRTSYRAGTDWAPAPETDALRTDPHPEQGTPYVLEVNAECIEDADGASLVATFTYTDDLDASAATDIANLWASVLPEFVDLSSFDVALAGVDRAGVDRVSTLAGVPLAHIWPLSPLQEGLYFQAQYAGDGDVYIAQNVVTFDRRLDVARLERAAAALLLRHPAAAAGFTGDTLPNTVQFIPARPRISVTVVGDERAPEFVEEDRVSGFDLDAPPLLRLSVIRGSNGCDRLLFTYHLLLWDGWSRELVLTDFFAAYESDAALLRPLTAGFDDYLVWLACQESAAAQGFWAAELAGLEGPTLVAGTPKAALGASPTRPHTLVRTLPSTLSGSLVDAARVAGVTLNSLLTVALASVLGYATGSHDVVLGTTVSGRPTDIDGVDAVVGVFLNTVPVRVRLTTNASVLDCAREVQSHRVAAMPYEHLGLGEIQRASGQVRLFDSLFVLQNFLTDSTFTEFEKRHHITGVEAADSTHYPFTWVVTPGARLAVKLEFRPDLVTEDAALGLLDRFESTAAQIAEESINTLAALRMELPREAELRRSVVSDAGADIGLDSIADLLARQADRTPDATALVFAERRLTFAEFDSEVTTLAHVLLASGCGPEQIVALALPRSIDAVVTLFAVLRAGAAYLPLELDYPDERLLGILADATPSLLVTTAATANRFGDTVRTLVLDAPETVGLRSQQSEDRPADDQLGSFTRTAPNRLDHTAYVIYTSGSTGTPKGVVTPYRGLTNMQINHQREIFDPVVESVRRTHGRDTVRIAHTVSFSFDMSWEELLWLVEGHEVHICDEELRRDATALVSYCDSHGIDVVNVTPTYAHHLIGEGLLEGAHRPALVLLGGEAVSNSVWQSLRSVDGVLGYNLYGPTEYTINTLGGGTGDSDLPTTGTPISNTAARVLDSWLRPVPDGVAGELYIAGAGLGRGYLGRYARTAERFVADPFSDTADRMYRTGDLVRRGRNGQFEFLGRSDDQVKIRGYRVETGEVESAIAAVDGVARVAVVAGIDPSTPGAKRLAAYVLPCAGVDSDAFLSSIRQALLAQLPEYMVPSLYATVDALPLTMNGKLDVRALPEARPLASSSRGPNTEFERRVCALFADVLGVDDKLGADDDFFVLGGHSMVAIRLLGRIRREFGVTLSIRDLFELRTAVRIATCLEQSSPDARTVLLESFPSEEFSPLSAAQERLWLVDRLAGGSSAYTYPLVVRLRGELHHDALAQALNDVAGRHEVLRTVIDDGTGSPRQHLSAAEVPFTVASCTGATWTGDEILDAVRAEVDRPFDLVHEIPIRATVLDMSDSDRVLVLVLHHVATDEWSDRPFLDDLDTAYRARVDGLAPKWTPLPVQYADYARWQRAVLGDPSDASSGAHRQLEYWRSALAGIPTETALPLDRERAAARSAGSKQVRCAIDPAVVEALRGIAAEHGASVFMVLHAAVAALLHRLGAGEDIVVGSPISGRNDVALDDLVGFFVNTLALRSDLSGNPTFASLVDRTRAVDLDAFEHQELPFQQVVSAIGPERAAGLNPLFQVVVGYHHRTDIDRAVLGLGTEWLDGSNAAAKFDLHFSFVDIASETDPQLLLSLEYATDLFDDATVDALTQRLRQVLGAVAENPATPVSSLPVHIEGVDPAALASRTSGPEGTLVHRFAAAAQAFPTATAVVSGSRRWTYAELSAKSDSLAQRLVASGVVPEDRVAIALPRSGEQILAMLAVVKAGAAYVPLDVTYPKSRLDYILADSGAALVITSTDTAAVSADANTAKILIDNYISADSVLPMVDSVLPMVDVQSAAYVIYTSGSTGNPKGVVVPHGGVLALLDAAEDKFDFDEHDVWTMFHSFAFDFSVWEIWGPLLRGAALVIVDFETSRSPSAMAELLVRENVTILSQTPSAFVSLIETNRIGRAEALRYVVFGGEALDVRKLRSWFSRAAASASDTSGGPSLVNMYGITETCVHVSFHHVEKYAAEGGHGSVIGTALPGLDVYVLDRYLNPVPRGVVGEMYIAGTQLARGYLGKQALSSTRFVANPASPGARLYRSGDLARWVVDVSTGMLVLDYVGRADDQLELRGFRIEPGEIEASIVSVEGVQHAAVLLRENRLVAYVVGSASLGDVETHVKRTLPSHQVPSAFLALESLPLTANGKLDRRALPDPDFGSLVTSREPVTDTEAQLAVLFADVLGLPRVGVEDSFFHLGGHSLLAMRVLSGIAVGWGIELQMRSLFDHPSVRELAGVVDEAPEATATVLALEDIVRPDVLPLSYAQHRMWAMYRVDGASETYNVPLAWALDGMLDAAALVSAVDDVVRRHEALRTIYPDVDGEPVASIVETENICDITETATVDDIRRYLDEAARYRFELDRELPVRAHLVTSEPDRWALIFVVHHIAIDEWAVSTVTADLAFAYAARTAGREPRWREAAAQYQDYALWQRARLGSDRESGTVAFAERGYWTRQLVDLPVEMALPTDRRRPENPSGDGGIGEFTLDRELADALREVASDAGITMFVLAHALVTTLLVKVGAGQDVIVGTPISGRSAENLHSTVGLFLNSLVLRVDAAGDPTFEELLGRVRETDLAAFAHQELPFDRVVDAVDPQRTRARHPLFQTMLVYIAEDSLDTFELPGATVTTIPMGTGASKFDLGINLIDRGTTIDLEMEFAREMFDDATVETLARRFVAIAREVTQDPRRRLSAIDVLEEGERSLILEQFNDTAEPKTHDTIPALFAVTARANPDAVAVVAGERRLSYAELGTRVYQLAHHLRRRGIGAEDVVAVSLPRSAEMVVAVLAILAAGGAFVPLDPMWPEERRAHVLADARVQMTVGSECGGEDVRVSLDHWDYSEEPAEPPSTVLHGGSLAYVIFTSGSTGKPKGAMIRHEAICSRLLWQRDRILGFGAGDASLFKAPLAFDISVNEIVLPLVSGGAVVVAEPEAERDPLYLLDLIDRERVTFVYLVSSMLSVLLELAEGTDRLSNLRHVWCGGEVLTPTLFDRFRRQLGTTMYHGYGPAEATIGVSHVVYRGDAERIATSIGRPNPNTRLYVLDNGMAPVPVGVAGELYAGGFLLGRGYVHAAGLTASRFVADPFDSGERIYRTGDLARWNADGTLDFLGRADNQVKIRGMRLELEDVEVALASHPSVRQSAVLALDNAAGSKYLAGYVRLDPGAQTTAAELISDAASKLPEFMVPAAVVIVEEFPVTANGKLDRRALPEPQFASASQRTRMPLDALETDICAAFASVLGIDEVGVDQDFFALGGDSISVVRLVSALRKRGVSVRPRQLFEHRTPEAVAALAQPTDVVAPSRTPTESASAPLTPTLQWMVDNAVRLETFGSPMVLVVPADANAQMLERSLQAVTRAHEMLRSRLVRDADEWAFETSENASVSVRIVDARGVQLLENLIRGEAEVANLELDAYRGIVLRAVWFDRGPDEEGRLLLIAHHMAVDGMSWRVITEDLASAYRQELAGKGADLETPALSYAQWARTLAAAVHNPDVIADLPYWFDATEEVPTLRSGRAISEVHTRVQVSTQWTAGSTAILLSEATRVLTVGSSDILAAALAVAVNRWRGEWTDSDSILPTALSLQGHGRHENLVSGTDVARTVGWFAQDYPVMLGQTMDQALDDLKNIPHEGATFGMSKYLSGAVGRALARRSKPEIFFNYHGTFGAPELRQWQMDPSYGRIFADWEADRLDGVLVAAEARIVPSDSGHVLELSLSSRPFGLHRDAVEALLSDWISVLDSVVNDM